MDNLAININKDVESQALAIPEKAQVIIIDSKESMAWADQFKKNIKTLIKEIDDTFKPLAEKAFAAHRAITKKWNETKDPLIGADELITSRIKAYIRKIDEERLAEERRLREIARKEEEERRLVEAIELEKEGNMEEAQAVIAEPMNIVTPTVKVDIPQIDKRMYRTNWYAKVIDKNQLIKFVATRLDYADCLEPNMSILNQKARSLKDALNIPGVVIIEE